MLELASLGAGVMHSRSIEFGKKFDVPIHVPQQLHAISPARMIVAEPERPDQPVSGAAITKDEARITVARRARPAGHEPRDFLADRGQGTSRSI